MSTRFRLIKPNWGKPDHQSFVKEIKGDDTLEGYFKSDFLKAKNEEGYNIYFFPNYNSKSVGKFLNGSDVDIFEWVFVDMDLKDGKYKTKVDFIAKVTSIEGMLPNIIRDSGNGIHAYWRVSDLTREHFVELQLRLLNFFDTDTSIWTVLQLMRYPGFYNTKDPANFKLVEDSVIQDEAYTYEILNKYLPPISISDLKKMEIHLAKIDGIYEPPELDDLEVDQLPEKFIELLNKNEKIQELFSNEVEGTRSETDMSLANSLFSKDFSKKEALQVMLNTSKARSKGSHRISYASAIIEKVYTDRVKFTVPSVADRKKQGFSDKQKGFLVRGPKHFDCMQKPWRTGQVLGIVGGSGIGKSTVTLDIFKDIIDNNPEDDGIFVYFNLEMPEYDTIEKWDLLTDGDSKAASRLYVVSNEDENGDPRHINLQKIFWYCRDLEKSTGKKIRSIAIDHIGIINPTIDITKKPSFGLEGEMENSFGSLRNINARTMPKKLKELAKQLDVFLVIQSQTTKEKGKDGDYPLGIDAAYGASQFEHYMDYIITIWQPLRRVQHKTKLHILGWQYCKIRFQHKDDAVKPYDKRMLFCDLGTGSFRALTEMEIEEFNNLNKEASILRKKAEKKEEVEYANSISKSISRLRAISSKGA